MSAAAQAIDRAVLADGSLVVAWDGSAAAYYCLEGTEAEDASGSLRLWTENGVGSIDRLTDWFYRAQDTLYFLHDDLALETLAEKVEDVVVDAAGRWLYYVSEGNIYRMDDPMKRWRKTVQLTDQLDEEDTTSFYSLDVAPDGGSLTFFTAGDRDSALFRMSSDGVLWPTLEEAPSSRVSLNGGAMWAMTDDGRVVFAKEDEPPQCVMENSLFAANGVLKACAGGDQALLAYISDGGEGRVWRLSADGEARSLLRIDDQKEIINTRNWSANTSSPPDP